MVPKTVATDTKKGAGVKAHASKAPAKAAAAKATSESSKKPAAQKQTPSAAQTAHGASSKKAAPHAGSKVSSKAAASPSQKSATSGAAPKSSASSAPAKATKPAKTSDKSRPEQPAPAKKAAAGTKSRTAAKPGSGSKAHPAAKAQPAAKASLAPATRPSKASSPARPGVAGVGLGHKAAPVKRVTEGYVKDEKFLASQRVALERERATYLEQAASLKAEAESLVEEMEPGDIQFDDESGEGGTVTVDRERDLALSAQALAAVEEIDHALAKMNNGTYGICENCGRLIPKARLEALPYARLCIDCKSGGLSRR